MRLFVPYTALHPVLPLVLEQYGLAPIYVDVSSDDEAYWRFLRDVWADRKPLVIVEHDVLPWPGCVEELAGCPGLYCSATYRLTNREGRPGLGISHAFGCTAFKAELMDRMPDVWDQMPDRHWSTLDTQFYHAALAAGEMPHPHRPGVIHLPRMAS